MGEEHIYEPEMGDTNPIVVRYPDKAFTDSVGPCLAVAVLDKKNRVGYLSHIFFGTAYGPTVEKALWKSDTKNLEVLVAGNIPFSREEIVSNEEVGTMIGLGDKDFEQMREEQQKYTKAIKDYLESRGFKEGENLTIKIPNTPIKGTYSVLVDTVEGKISSKIELLEDTL